MNYTAWAAAGGNGDTEDVVSCPECGSDATDLCGVRRAWCEVCGADWDTDEEIYDDDDPEILPNGEVVE